METLETLKSYVNSGELKALKEEMTKDTLPCIIF